MNYMHNFKTAAKKPPELIVGKRYHILGYHTGDFTGVCKSVDSTTAVFTVKESRSLDWESEVEIPLALAKGGGSVKISD